MLYEVITGLGPGVALRESRPATDAELALFHDPAYVAAVTARCGADAGVLDHGPTPARS